MLFFNVKILLLQHEGELLKDVTEKTLLQIKTVQTKTDLKINLVYINSNKDKKSDTCWWLKYKDCSACYLTIWILKDTKIQKGWRQSLYSA